MFAEINAIANGNLKKEVARLPVEGKPAVVASMSALQNRIDLFNRPDADGKTPLMLAASQEWEDLAVVLIDGGAKPEARDKRGSSAADYAKTAEFISLADFLNKASATIP